MLEIKNTFLVKRILVANLAVFALFSAYAQQQPLKTFSLKMQKSMLCKTNRKQKMHN
jgi:hypothetical protein